MTKRETKREAIVAIKQFLQESQVGRAVSARYFLDPEPPEIFFELTRAVRARLEDMHCDVDRESHWILSGARNFIVQAGLLSGAPSAEAAELYWLIRLRTESPHFHALDSGGFINDVLQATIELLRHLAAWEPWEMVAERIRENAKQLDQYAEEHNRQMEEIRELIKDLIKRIAPTGHRRRAER